MVGSEEKVSISENTILELSFEKEVPERSEFEKINLSTVSDGNIGKKLGLNDIVASIKKAEADSIFAI